MQNKIQDIQKEVNSRFLEWQKASKFPKALYTIHDQAIIDAAFKYYTPQHLKLSLEGFEELYNKGLFEYDLHQFSNIMYMLQNLTANDLNMEVSEYLSLQHDIKNMTVEWQRIVSPKNQELMDEANDKIQEIQEEEQAKMNEKINNDLKEEKGKIIEMPVAQA